MHVLKSIKRILMTPNRFFNTIDKDNNFMRHILFQVFLILFIMIFLTYTYIQQINAYVSFLAEKTGFSLLNQIPLNLSTYIAFYLSLAIIFIILSFLRYWIIHWFVILFRGSHGYKQTYKAIVYARAPEYFSAPIFLAIILLIPFAESIYVIVSIIFFTIIFLAISIYQMYLKTKGLSKLQKITPLKSFISIYFFGLIGQLLIVGIIELVLLLILAVIYIL